MRGFEGLGFGLGFGLVFRVQGFRALGGLGYLGLRVWGYTHALALKAHVGIWYAGEAPRGAHMVTAEPNDNGLQCSHMNPESRLGALDPKHNPFTLNRVAWTVADSGFFVAFKHLASQQQRGCRILFEVQRFRVWD